MTAPGSAAPLLQVEGLRVAFPHEDRMVEAVRGVDLHIAPGEAVGVVGESGSGKSVSALAMLRLIAPPGRIVGGTVRFRGQDLLGLPERAMRRIRGREISMVFQDPLTSLNPAFTVGTQLVDVIRAHQRCDAREARGRAAEALHLVGIPSPERRLDSYPHEFSGGMRQRALIAMAIACRPALLIADEPTTALDVTIQAQVMALLRRLREELGLAVLFISHNLDLVAELCDRIVVMYAGRVAEEAAAEELFRRPRHPYTRLLLRCVPRLTGIGEQLYTIDGAPPALGGAGSGCAFAPRCPEVRPACAALPQPSGEDGHRAWCWAAGEAA